MPRIHTTWLATIILSPPFRTQVIQFRRIQIRPELPARRRRTTALPEIAAGDSAL
jgi:hypothetical protein